eukprot:2838402-Amphidinium_carterae.1
MGSSSSSSSSSSVSCSSKFETDEKTTTHLEEQQKGREGRKTPFYRFGINFSAAQQDGTT